MLRVNRLAALAPLLVACTLVACGTSSRRSNGEASKPPSQILHDAAAALEAARSLQVQATVEIARRPTAVTMAIERPHDIAMKLQHGPESVLVTVTGGSAYMNANSPFWEHATHAQGPALGLVAGRWLKVSPHEGFEGLYKSLDISKWARCLTQDHGTLSVDGTTTTDGQRAVVLVDHGDRPGTAPGRLYVAASGPAWPLRAVATGLPRPGAKPSGECAESGKPVKPGQEITFSRYDHDFGITAPAGAVSLHELLRQAGAGAAESS